MTIPKLTLSQAQEVLAMEDPTQALVEASRLEHGGWSVEQAHDVLLARVALNVAVEDALERHGIAGGGA